MAIVEARVPVACEDVFAAGIVLAMPWNGRPVCREQAARKFCTVVPIVPVVATEVLIVLIVWRRQAQEVEEPGPVVRCGER